MSMPVPLVFCRCGRSGRRAALWISTFPWSMILIKWAFTGCGAGAWRIFYRCRGPLYRLSDLRQKLSGCGLDVLPSGDLPSGVVAAWYPAAHYDQAEAILKKYDIHISHHAGYLRLSIAAHSTEEQMEIVAEAFREIGGLKGR